MDENIAPVAARASMSWRVQSQISASKPASAIRWTRSVTGRSRNIISAQTASRMGATLHVELLPYDAGHHHPRAARHDHRAGPGTYLRPRGAQHGLREVLRRRAHRAAPGRGAPVHLAA